jgi:hypothetical protein
MAKLECISGKETMEEIDRLNIMFESNRDGELGVLLLRKIHDLSKKITNVTFKKIEGAIVEEWWCDEHGDFHREDGPAVVTYTLYGTIMMVRYYIGGKCHRTDGPATINYLNDGSVLLEEWSYNDEFHRIDGPARIKYWDIDYGPRGGVEWEMWYMYGEQRHEAGYFSKVDYWPNGQLRSTMA